MTGSPDRSGFEEFFKKATGHKEPFDYQRRLAEEDPPPSLINIPTGAGKTAAVILSWLWRRRFAAEATRNATPRRLIYCLPMRVLVEQTRNSAILWLHRLGLLGGRAILEGEIGKEQIKGYIPSWNDSDKITVTVLMGGEDADEWDLYPERDAILIGTQDMLLSRALNRGYGMSRYRWPIHFGLFNNDCLWVIDEVQLLGSGLATTSQLQAFRRLSGNLGYSRTVWMSATLEPSWLGTVDMDLDIDAPGELALGPSDEEMPELRSRMHAKKAIQRAKSSIGDVMGVAEEIMEVHQAESRTLVVLNTVKRAVELYAALKKQTPKANLVLVHSRFRPRDRKAVVDRLLAEPSGDGTIIVSTQVIEAGVDVSAKTLFVEAAPWSSLVQRFGRCNRYGEYDVAKVFWIDLPPDEKEQSKLALPYELVPLLKAREVLSRCSDVGPSVLPHLSMEVPHDHVLRSKDLVELFDTTPDLSGRDIDISRFIRDTTDQDVLVFWRDLLKDEPSAEESRPSREELCSVPIGDIRDLIKNGLSAWVWDALEGVWSPVARSTPIYPGITLMLRAADGRYTEAEGWNIKSKRAVPVILDHTLSPHKYDDDLMSERDWKSVAEHSDLVVQKVVEIADAVGFVGPWRTQLVDAARWHDAGKAHQSFQALIKPEMLLAFPKPPVAKAPKEAWRRDSVPDRPTEGDPRRRYFRHELASGLLTLMHGRDDLVAYLAASHHGKVRLSIRSLPKETKPPEPNRRFARGVWDGETIPQRMAEVDLGSGVKMAGTEIDLSFMELGEGPRGPSWLARMLALRDRSDLGPFRLALLEALLKVADERASGAGI